MSLAGAIASPAGAFAADRNATIRGRLAGDPTRGPLEDAWVHAVPASAPSPDAAAGGFYGFPGGFGIWYRPIPVDPDGRFALSLPCGRYWLRAGALGYGEVLRQVDVCREDASLGDLSLAWAGVARLRIRALFEDGTPVSLRAIRLAARFTGGGDAETHASTDDEGYALVLVRPERYRLRLAEPAPGSARFDLDLRDGELRDVAVRIGCGAYASGRVVDVDGKPVAGALVACLSASAALRPLERWLFDDPDAVTGPDGRFHIGPLAPGAQVIAARRPGLARGRSSPVPLRLRERARDLEVRLSEPDPGEGGLIVRVLREGGDPVGGADVRVVRDGKPEAFAGKTNALGYLGINRIPAGDIEVEAVLSDPSKGLVVATGRVRASLAHGAHRELCVSLGRE